MMGCPRCGSGVVEHDKCTRCGVVASVYAGSLEKMRRPPTPREPPQPAASQAAPAITAPTTSPAAEETPVAPASAGVAASYVRKLTFHGSAGTLFGIYVVNVLLTLLTLGCYRFWGRVRIRRFMMSQTAFEGDRFAHHGTGRELLLGFLKAVLVVGVPAGVLFVTAHFIHDQTLKDGLRWLISIVVFLFLPIAMVGARRYRLSRTSWRGIRFSFRGQTATFTGLFVLGTVVSILTLTLYYPFFEARQRRFMISQSYFGRRPFRFDGRGRDLLRPHLLNVLLLLPTFGLSWFWYRARRTRYFWEHTYFETARFRCTVRGRELMNLVIGNVIVLLGTLGLAWPWVAVRSTRFYLDRLLITGPIDLGGVSQELQAATATGDALSSLLGADVEFA